jgi:hypothetical protein
VYLYGVSLCLTQTKIYNHTNKTNKNDELVLVSLSSSIDLDLDLDQQKFEKVAQKGYESTYQPPTVTALKESNNKISPLKNDVFLEF